MNYSIYIYSFIGAFILSFLFTILVKNWAIKHKLYDQPAPRKVHSRPIPRLGGLAFFVSFFLLILFFLIFKPDMSRFSPWLWLGGLVDKKLLGVLIGAIILIIVGIIDDKKNLPPVTKLSWQIIAALVVIASGIGIDYIRNPFGGPFIYLDHWQIPIHLYSQTYHFVVLGDLFVIAWIVLIINVMNFLDGLDGLAAGVSFIALMVLFSLSLLPEVNQLQTALLCIIAAGAIAGFLPHNFFPAKIFMGDTGSMFLGYIIAVLAVISGGKVATSLLVLGFPVLDGLWVVGRRLIHKSSPFLADKKHLHHRLLAIGLNQKQAVLLIYLLSICFGVVALISNTKGKLGAFIGLLAVMLILATTLIMIEWKKEHKISKS